MGCKNTVDGCVHSVMSFLVLCASVKFSLLVNSMTQIADKIKEAFVGDVEKGVNHLFEDSNDTSLLAPGYRIEDSYVGKSGNNTCKKHIWIMKDHSTIVAKFRRCNGRIEVKVKEYPNRWVEFEVDMVVTPNAKEGGRRRKARTRTRKTRR